MITTNLSAVVNKTQLRYILGVSYPTALKHYQNIIDSLQLKRSYLTVKDLIDFGIL